jgi:hypothetical protein
MLKKIIIFIALFCVWVMAVVFLLFGVFTAGLPAGQIPFPAIAVYIVATMIPVWPFVEWMNATPGWMKKVQAEGKPATATILNVKHTGVVISHAGAVVKLQLRVEPPDEAPFEVGQDRLLPTSAGWGGLHIGARIRVKYDPNNKKHVVILSHS